MILGTIITLVGSGINILAYGAKNRWLGPVTGVLLSSPCWWLYVYMYGAYSLIAVNIMFHVIHSFNLWKVWRESSRMRRS